MVRDKKPTAGRILLQMALVLPALGPVSQGALADTSAGLAKTVNELGLRPSEPGYGFDQLAREPHEAVALLVGQLHPIDRGPYFENKKTDQSRHVIACLRALHYITGRTFVVTTATRLNDSERQFLDFDKKMHDSNPSHKIHFFAVWMSRNAEFVAPHDAQLAIIKEWKRFQRDEGSDFKYRPAASADKSMEDWYWFG
jgi:hypothetical protein